MTDRVIVKDDNGNNVSTINSGGTIYTNSIVNARVNVRVKQGSFTNKDGTNNSGLITLFQDVEPGIYSLSCILETSGTTNTTSFNVQFSGKPLQGCTNQNTDFPYTKGITNMYNFYYYLQNTQTFYIQFLSASIPTGQSLDVLYYASLIYIGSDVYNANSGIVPIQATSNIVYSPVLNLPNASGIDETSSKIGSNPGSDPEEAGSDPGEAGSDPGEAGSDPEEADSDPGEAGSEPEEAGSDPGEAGSDPGEAGSDPGEAGSDPGEAGSDPEEAGSDPGEAGSDPEEAGSDPGEAGSDPGEAGSEPSSP